MIAQCILTWSLAFNLDPALVTAVIKHESGGDRQAVGAAGEIGLMQILPQYVPETREQLFDGCTNIKRGVQILAAAKKYWKGSGMGWLNCYNVGNAGCEKIKHPTLFPYYRKVIGLYNQGRLNATRTSKKSD